MVVSLPYYLHYLTFGVAVLVYLPFVVISNKAQNTIDEEESEEDIANASFKIRGSLLLHQNRDKSMFELNDIQEDATMDELEKLSWG